MSIEAMKLALEALESPILSDEFEQAMKMRLVADNLKTAIEEAEKQEPIAGWYSFDESGKLIRVDPRAYPDTFKLYTTPPAREWKCKHCGGKNE